MHACRRCMQDQLCGGRPAPGPAPDGNAPVECLFFRCRFFFLLPSDDGAAAPPTAGTAAPAGAPVCCCCAAVDLAIEPGVAPPGTRALGGADTAPAFCWLGCCCCCCFCCCAATGVD